MRLRKDVNIYLHHPSEKFFQVAVELRNVPGALHGLLGVVSEMNLNVLSSFSSVDPFGKTGVWSAFVKDSDHTTSELKRRISASKYVLDSVVMESNDGFLVDNIHFPLAFNTGDRAVMMGAGYIARMLAAVRKEFGSGGDVIVYNEGRSYGKDVGAYYNNELGVEFVRSNLLSVLKLYQALGWFKIEEMERNQGGRSAVLRVSECFECEGKTSPKPYSHFVRGHLGGSLSAYLGEDLECEETKCIAVGSRFCEFSLKPKA